MSQQTQPNDIEFNTTLSRYADNRTRNNNPHVIQSNS